jgi:hypothetical protein
VKKKAVKQITKKAVKKQSREKLIKVYQKVA